MYVMGQWGVDREMGMAGLTAGFCREKFMSNKKNGPAV
jgi:hypothetical protein